MKRLAIFKDISNGLLLGKGLVYGTNFTDSAEERASLLRPQSEAQAKKHAYGQVNQSAIVDEFLGRKTKGFFIESGAWDGEYLSNSLFFERKRNWTGLLVEPNRLAFKSMVLRGNRKRLVKLQDISNVRQDQAGTGKSSGTAQLRQTSCNPLLHRDVNTSVMP